MSDILAVKDHTQIMNFIVKDAKRLAESLPDKKRFTESDVLNAAVSLRLGSTDDRAKMRAAMKGIRDVSKGELLIPASTRLAIQQIHSTLAQSASVPIMIQRLTKAAGGTNDKLIKQAVKIAIQVLEDGASTIYTAQFYQDAWGVSPAIAKENAPNIAAVDAGGVVAGGVRGFLGGLASPVPGGAAGGALLGGLATGIGASAGAIIIGWLS